MWLSGSSHCDTGRAAPPVRERHLTRLPVFGHLHGLVAALAFAVVKCVPLRHATALPSSHNGAWLVVCAERVVRQPLAEPLAGALTCTLACCEPPGSAAATRPSPRSRRCAANVSRAVREGRVQWL